MPPDLILEKNDAFYRLPLWESLGVKAFFTTRAWDMRFPVSRKASTVARRRAYEGLGLCRKALVCPDQVHGDRVHVVTRKDEGRGAFFRDTAIAATDALVTDEAGVCLGILTADCLPVFLVDGHRRACGLVHAGWKSIRKGILEKTVSTMRKSFSTRPGDLCAALGPSIRSCCYEVGRDFSLHFREGLVRRAGKTYFDLAGAAVAQLQQAGLDPGRIYDSRLCTSCKREEFFSYRREGEGTGRSMSVLEIAERRTHG